MAFQFEPVLLEAVAGLAELVPCGLLVAVEVAHFLVIVGEVFEVFLEEVELLDELESVRDPEQPLHHREAAVNRLLAGVVAGVGQRLRGGEVVVPVAQLVLEVDDQPRLASASRSDSLPTSTGRGSLWKSSSVSNWTR